MGERVLGPLRVDSSRSIAPQRMADIGAQEAFSSVRSGVRNGWWKAAVLQRVVGSTLLRRHRILSENRPMSLLFNNAAKQMLCGP